ncbi:hypothetical protein PV341_28935 [Streptomyces sp. PA03-1a]|nr:hypothetical protein [Streptomyces sp. PA03-1a]
MTDPRIGPALSRAINCLARASGYKVMVVAHSMGGLATQFAVSLPTGQAGRKTWQNVAEVITIGTPTRGSIAASIAQHLPFEAAEVARRPELVLVLEGYLGFCAGWDRAHDSSSLLCTDILGALRGPQGRALAYNSSDIKKLPPWPPDLPVQAIAGDNRLRFSIVEILKVKTIPELSLGDVAVPLGSATAYTNKTGAPYVLTCRASNVPLWWLKDSKCNHTNIKTEQTVISAVINQTSHMQRHQAGRLTPELAYASGNTVKLWSNGVSKTLATMPEGYRAGGLTWSANGEYLAWSAARSDGSGLKVYRYPRGAGESMPSSPRIRTWDCKDCGTLAFRGDDLLSDGAFPPEQAALWSFPQVGKRRVWPVKSLRPDDACFGPSCGHLELLGPGPKGTVSVAYIAFGGNFTGVGQLYRVDGSGNVSPLEDVPGSGSLGTIAVSPRRDKVAVSYFGHLSACEEYSNVAIVDQESGQVTAPGQPPLPGNAWLVSAWFDSEDQAYAAFRAEPGCRSDDTFNSDGQRVHRWGATHVYRLSDGQWEQTTLRPVLARQSHAAGKTATLLGKPNDDVTGGFSGGELVAQNLFNQMMPVAQGVTTFAWRPASP